MAIDGVNLFIHCFFCFIHCHNYKATHCLLTRTLVIFVTFLCHNNFVITTEPLFQIQIVQL